MSGYTLARRDVIAYGLPNTVAALPVIPIAVLLPSWYATHSTLSLLSIGLALAMARLADFFSDAMVGILVDKGVHPRWRYKPWILTGTLIACTALFALAVPPDQVSMVWLAIWAAVLFTGWTLIMVPYTAWGAELATNHDDRTRLTNSREIAGVIGMIAAISMPVIFGDQGNPIKVIAVVASVMAVPALALSFLCLPDLPAGSVQGRAGQWKTALSLLRVRPFISTMLYWFLNGIANGLPAVLFPIVVAGYFGFGDKGVYQLLLLYFGSAVVFSPLWIMLSRRLGKTETWRAALALSIAAFLPALVLAPHQSDWFIVICVLTGAALAADLSLPPSIQADVLQFDRERSDYRRSGSAFALWSMTTKLALGIAVAIGFAGLDLLGVDSRDGISLAESRALMALYVAVPVLLKTLIVLLSRRFDSVLESAAQ